MSNKTTVSEGTRRDAQNTNDLMERWVLSKTDGSVEIQREEITKDADEEKFIYPPQDIPAAEHLKAKLESEITIILNDTHKTYEEYCWDFDAQPPSELEWRKWRSRANTARAIKVSQCIRLAAWLKTEKLKVPQEIAQPNANSIRRLKEERLLLLQQILETEDADVYVFELWKRCKDHLFGENPLDWRDLDNIRDWLTKRGYISPEGEITNLAIKQREAINAIQLRDFAI